MTKNFRTARTGVLLAAAIALVGCESPYSFSTSIPAKPAPAAASTQSGPAVLPSLPAPVPSTSGGGVGSIVGHVVDATNNSSLSSVQVTLSSGASTFTDRSGNYSFSNLSPGSYNVDFSDAGYIEYKTSSPAVLGAGQTVNENAALSPELASGELRVVMGWTSQKAGAVRDMDGYLKVPNYSTPVYYANCDQNPASASFTQCSVSGAYQDVDATDWVGPETITITNQASSGTYTYYVANYSDYCNSNALGNSAITVTVYSGNSVLKQYNVPQGSGVGYKVFTLTNGVISDVQQFMTGLTADTTSVSGLIIWKEPGTDLFFNSSSTCYPQN